MAQVWEAVSAQPFLWGSVAMAVGMYIFDDVYLALRERSTCAVRQVPKPLASKLTQAQFDKARSYKYDVLSLDLLHNAYTFVENTAMLVSGFLPLAWTFSGQLLRMVGQEPHPNSVLQGVTFVTLTSLASFVLDLPWTVYHTFVLEQSHGFNKQTPWFFVKDNLKAVAVNNLIAAVVVGALLKVAQWAGDRFFFYAWLTMGAVTLVLTTIYPEFIAPLFDKYTELPPGPLRERIEALAASVEFPLRKLYLVHNSVRSSHSNAYFYGWGSNKRIVLFDTLLTKELRPPSQETDQEEDEGKGCNTEQILAVLAHELGHWKMNHVLQLLVVQQLYLLALFWLFQQLNRSERIYSDFGFHTERPLIIGLQIILGSLMGPVNAIFMIGINFLTRRNEFQADKYAKGLRQAQPLVEALVKLSADNKSFPVSDWLYSTVHRSHPGLLERIEALQKSE